MCKESKQVIKELESRGWVFVRYTGTGHMKLRFKNGATTIVPKTPSDSRWLKNKWAEVKRCEEHGAQRN